MKKQFRFDQDVPIGLQETMTSTPDLRPFIKSRAFAHWEGEISRIMVPSGHRFGFNTPSMNAYWQRLADAMVEYVNIGRSDKTPISIHRKLQTFNPCLSPPSQSPYPMATVKSLGLLNGMKSGVVGLRTPYIFRHLEGILSTLWRNASLCLPSGEKGIKGMLPWT